MFRFWTGEAREQIGDVGTLSDRLSRVELLAQYLRKQWIPLAPVAIGFNWNYEMSRLLRQIGSIRGPYRR
jgi:hypothetical protein